MITGKKLEYTLVAEGYAEHAFIPVYLRKMAEISNIQAVKSKLDTVAGRSNKPRVYAECHNILIAFINSNYNLFIVGVDLDEPDHEKDQPIHKAECDKLIKELGKPYQRFSDKIIIYVPVQALEHWLVYQHHRVSNTKAVTPNSLESDHQDKLKDQLYKHRRDGDAMQTIAKQIAENADFEELAKQSRSFCHFHHQVKAFLTAFAA